MSEWIWFAFSMLAMGVILAIPVSFFFWLLAQIDAKGRGRS